MIRLDQGAAATRNVLPPGRDPVAWHRALTAEIAAHLSAAHAAVLARPEPGPGNAEPAWWAEGGASTRFGDLPDASRRQLDRALGAILSDIRRLAESGVAPTVREAWPALRSVPDMGYVHAVDGRPVMAGWGRTSQAGGAGAAERLARLDDGIAWQRPPRKRWGPWAAAAAVLALLALGSGWLLPHVAVRLASAPAACRIVPGQLEAMREQAAEESRGAELRTLLGTVDDAIGRKRLSCPVPTAAASPAPPVTAPTPAPTQAPTQAPTPSPHADLPQDRWSQGDLSMLEGCWTLDSGLRASSLLMPDGSPVTSWRQCFDGHGAGHQTIVLQDGRRCEGPLAASFDAEDRLRVTEPQPCTGSLMMSPSQRTCRRVSNAEAVCDGRNLAGPLGGRTYTGTFRR